MKNKLAIIFIIIIGIVLYALTLRGAFGNPTQIDIKEKFYHKVGAFESSHEIGPFGHIVSLVERGSYDLTREWADIAAPDVGQFNGKFYSYFAPGVPYLAYPFYKIGEYFGASQIATFFMEVLAAIIASIFIFKIAKNIFGLAPATALFSALVFAFGSTA